MDCYWTIIKTLRPLSALTLNALLITMISGCDRHVDSYTPPPPAVTVIKVQTEEISEQREFVARTEAFKSVSLRARVEGEITSRNFIEGQPVEMNQLLFEIDRDNYLASYNKTKADLSSAQAVNEKAQRDLTRGKELRPNGFISQSDMDTLTSNALIASANVASAKAAMENAKVNLDFTQIRAPFAGEISKVNFNIGSLVGPTSEPLATLIQVDPIYVNFQLNEAIYIEFLKKRADEPEASPQVSITFQLPNGDIHDHPGYVDYVDTQVDASTGTVSLRAVFPNPDKIVRPGLYVTLITNSIAKERLPLIPQYAVQQNQQGDFVLVVNEDQFTETRIVKMGRRVGPMWAVKEGLKEGEKIIVEGLQKVRSGSKVNPIVSQVDLISGVLTPVNNQP